jgi:hypothetical protein
MDKTLPHAPVHDLVVQPTAGDLVIGTHGRSIYRASVKELEKLNSKILAKPVHVFGVDNPTFSTRWGNIRYVKWYGHYEPEMLVPVYVKDGGIAKVNVYSKKGTLLYSADKSLEKGINYVQYDLSLDADKLAEYTKELKKTKLDPVDDLKKKDNDNFYLIQGDYKLEVSINGQKASVGFKIKEARQRSGR